MTAAAPAAGPLVDLLQTWLAAAQDGRMVAMDRLLDAREVSEMAGISTATIYQYMAAGTFPKARQLSKGCVRWRLSDIKAWMDGLPEVELKPSVS